MSVIRRNPIFDGGGGCHPAQFSARGRNRLRGCGARSLPTLEECLRQEYRFTYRSQEMGEFLEGIRAAVIDKDKKPNWKPARLEDLDPARIESLLAPLGAHELKLVVPEAAEQESALRRASLLATRMQHD
jgi:hypothetical protein